MTGNLENAHFVVANFVFVIDSFRALHIMCLFALSFHFSPEAREGSFFTALDLDFDMSGCHRLGYFNEDFAVDGVAWLVKGKLSLDLNFSTGENTPTIAEVKHSILITD